MTYRLCITGILFALGCGGGSQEQSAETTPDTAADADMVPSPPTPWAEMDFAAKQSWMASEVTPRMAGLFQEFDGERYADFNCATCHGENGPDNGFAMPNPDILQLHATGTPEQEQMVADHPEMVRFMFNRVLPTMQTLLGAPDYDDVTQEGFSCYACHVRAEEAPQAAVVPDATEASVAE